MNGKQKAALALALALGVGGAVVALKQDTKKPWAQQHKLAGACSYRANDGGSCHWADGGADIPTRYVVPGWAVAGDSCVPVSCVQTETTRGFR